MFSNQDIIKLIAEEPNFWESYDACMMTELEQDFHDPDSDSPQYQVPTPIVSVPDVVETPTVKQPAPSGYFIRKILPNVPVDPSEIEDDEIDIRPNYRQATHDTLLNSVINELKFKGLQPNQNHIEALREMVRVVMGNKELNRPVILPVIPGYGKTTLLLELIKDRLKNDPTWCAIIVLLRVEDIFKQIDQLPKSTTIAAWPTFRIVLECPNGQRYFDLNTCRACNIANCPVKTDLKKNHVTEPLSFKKQLQCIKGFGPDDYARARCFNCDKTENGRTCHVAFKGSPTYSSKRVIFITHEYYRRIVEHHKSLGGLTYCTYTSGPVKRQIFIDERPQLVDTRKITLQAIAKFSSIVRNKLPNHNSEIERAWNHVIGFFGSTEKTQAVGTDQEFKWKSDFKKDWKSLAQEGKADDPDLLYKYENMINSGGYYESKHFTGEEQVITLSQYSKKLSRKNRTVIFDGTGLFDQLYKDDRYYIHQILDRKRYRNLTFHISNQINLSKTYYDSADDTFYKEFCEDIVQLTKGYKTLVVCYKKNNQKFKSQLSAHGLYTDYWGNMRGKNDYYDATHVVFTGILDYGENVYAAMDLAISGDTDPSTFQDRMDRIKLNQMTMELYQQIYRSKLRQHNPQDEIHIYLATPNSELVNELKIRFRLCNVVNDWAPQPMDQSGKLQALIDQSSKLSENKIVYRFVDQYGNVPSTAALRNIWPGKEPSGYSNLRRAARKRLAEKTASSK